MMTIDSRIGGFGDVWMRLLALYTLSRLTGKKAGIIIHPALRPMAQQLFGERIEISSKESGDVIYTHMGLRHLLGDAMKGRRYVMPFYWLMRANRKTTTLKHRLNDIAVLTAAGAGFVRLTDPSRTRDYQGYMELTALMPYFEINFADFSRQAALDLAELQLRLQQIGSALAPGNFDVVVYPSGSAHQVMPPQWAAQHLPDAVFVFHQHDSYADGFESRGLKVARFSSPEELFRSGIGARRIFCTDSFPSHFWQVQVTNVALLMSQQIRSSVVHPAFPDAQIVTSLAPCCPCQNRARGLENAPCDMGHAVCLTWENPAYIASVKRMLS